MPSDGIDRSIIGIILASLGNGVHLISGRTFFQGIKYNFYLIQRSGMSCSATESTLSGPQNLER